MALGELRDAGARPMEIAFDLNGGAVGGDPM
jgi:hypothetical protein